MTGTDGEAADRQALRAEFLRRRFTGETGGRRTAVGRADRDRPLPLSSGQRQMWFLNRLEPESPEYLVPVALRLRGALDRTALSRAWNRLLVRHEILRTRYAMVGPEPVQLIDPAPDGAFGPAGLAVEDLSSLPAEEREAELHRRMEREAAGPVDLEHQWPIRGLLLRCADDDHVLVIVVHHIACDAWSTQLLVEEIGTGYRTFTAHGDGAEAAAGGPAVQYADYAVWEHTQARSPELRRQLDHWRGRLTGLTPLDLPADRRRPAVRGHDGEAVTHRLPAGPADRLRSLAGRHSTTPFTVLLTAYQALLSRYTGSTDIPVGTVVSGRSRPELQGLIGYGINSLVLRTRWDGDPAFGTLLDAVRETVLDAFDHQAVPFPLLVAELEPERDRSRTPVFQTLFTLRERTVVDRHLPGLRVERLAPTRPRARFDLALVAEEDDDGGYALSLEYATELYDRSTAERLLAHFVRLVTGAVAAPETRLSALELLDPAEYAELTAVPRPQAGDLRTVPELFAAQAARTPDAPAVVAGGYRLTYRELDTRANRLAHQLVALGVGPESRVGVCLDRGAELLPTLLGVLKAGGAYVALDPALPDSRIAFMLRDAGVGTTVTARPHTGRLASLHTGRLVVLDSPEHRRSLAARPDTDPAPAAGPDGLAYVVYTSGSTGRPKGVAVTHRNVVRLLATARPQLGFGADDVWSMSHSPAFDVSVFEMWGALLHGGTLVVVPAEVTRSPDDLVDLLAAERVTVLSQTPSAFRGLVAAAAVDDPRLSRLALRTVVFAGERLDIPDLAPWVRRMGLDAPRLVNMYGITETTVHSTVHRVTEADLDPRTGNPIGRPLADLALHLLDAHGRPVPAGATGEIHVGGPGVARGYLDRPALTAERFVPDPFGPPGARRYRSGDLARRRADGGLEFLGRADDQVKVRGYRIEPGEVTAALTAEDGIRDAVVLVSDEQLVAYVVPEGETSVDGGELRGRLGRTLPRYMVPAHVVPVESLPLTANGKVDRAALPAPGTGSGPDGAIAPRTPAEQRIAAVWQEVLALPEVGVLDNFFDRGGDSIRAVELVGALRAAGLDLAVRDVFAARTVAGLAELAAGRATATTEPAVRPFELISAEDRARLPAGLTDAYPMSRTQIGMAVDLLTGEGRSNYQNVASARVRDERPFDAAALREAARYLADRHEVLRTSFDLDTCSVPLQRVHANAVIPVEVHALPGLTPAESRSALDEFHERERSDLFDLSRAPLLRIAVHLTDAGWWLTVTEFHGIVEGWSYHSLLRELTELYFAFRDGSGPPPGPPLPVRYADAIAGELRALASAEDRAYWAGVVAGRPPFSLPAGWGDGSGPFEDLWESVPFGDLEDGLRALASAAGTSLKSVLVAAHGKVLSALTDQPEFTTGVVTHIRPETTGADRVYGMHLNTVPFGFDRGARTWRELVRSVFDREAEMWPHRCFPMPEIQRLAGGARVVEVLINHVDFDRLDNDALDRDSIIAPGTTEFQLAVTTLGGNIGLKTSTRVLSRANAARVAGMYRRVLEAMAADPDGDASGIPLPAGDHRLIETLRQPRGGYTGALLPRLIAEQAARTPHALAVAAGEDTLTYAELDARAHRVAHRLHALGAGPETVVGVRLERGADLIPCLLGIWRTGAAYLPLDPAQPAARALGTLDDARARLVLTHEKGAAELDHPGALVVDGNLFADASATPVEFPEPPADPDRLAYVIYTSGSTGRPKGVQVTHGALANHVTWAAVRLAGGAEGGSALFSSHAFDLVMPSIWAPLVAGQRLWLLEPDTDLSELGARLSAAGPFSFLKLTPGHLEVLTRQLDADRAAALAGTVLVAGEAFPGPLAGHWRDLLGPGRLLNEYGPTEATVGTSVYGVDGGQGEETVPIGRPLPGMSMQVLDPDLCPVPVGVVGELYVGGAGVARGYLGRPGLTAGRFLPDPGGPPGARMYRSGDLVRMRSDGNIAFVGRVDDQVKVRGHRVEPGEVAAAMIAHPGVREAVVVAAGGQLVGYAVAAAGGGMPTGDELRETLERSLPGYMVPSLFVELESLPLTANGKVDRSALPAPDPESAAHRRYVAPRTPAERRIAEVWAEALGLSRVGVEDSFFDLGGDSIRAVALVGAVRAAGFDVSVRDVFDRRTVAALAELAASRPVAAVTRPVAPFELLGDADRAKTPSGLVDAYPMAQTQIGMIAEMLADRELHRYHGVASFRIRDEKPFRADALTAAVRAAVERHEVLRTSFDLDGYSVPMQLVHSEAVVPVEVTDLRGLTPEEVRARLREFQARERADVFDVSRAPMLRVRAHLGDEGWWLTMVRCHAITEGWSNYNLLMELLDSYRSFRDGAEPARTEPPQVRYADFVAAEAGALASAEDRAYWTHVVERHPRFSLPEGWGDAGARSERYVLRVPVHDLVDGLRAFAARAQVPLKSVLLAAHLTVMSSLTAESSLFTGLVCDARPEAAGADRVPGMYLNTLPFVFEPRRRTWRELVRSVFEREVELWPHRHFPMPEIQRIARGGRLIDVSFNYLDFHQVDTALVDVGTMLADGNTEFALAVTTLAGHIGLSSHTGVLSRARAERLGGLYRSVLEAMTADPEADADSPVLPDGDREVLDGLNRTADAAPQADLLPALFVRQASRTPLADAVLDDTGRMSYAELDARSNQVAHRLRELGAGPEQVVGVVLNRGAELVTCLLGIWKAGAAYLPIDPAQPVARIRRLLDDAGVPVTLTRRDTAPGLDRPGTVRIDEDPFDDAPTTPLRLPAEPAGLAYVIYTSGSTGRPKGVQITHGALAARVAWTVGEHGLDGADRVLQKTSIGFDAAGWELFAPLVSGGTVVCAPPGAERDPGAMLRSVAEHRVTVLQAVPSVWRLLVDIPDWERCASLRLLFSAGEPLDADLARRLLSRPGPALWNTYGPTECTIDVTAHTVRADGASGPLPIGRPLPGTVLHVLDARMRPVPVGVTGELHVGGSGVARGYLGRPGPTAERFVPDPFGPCGARLYRTGDLARVRPDGTVEFRGRADDQVKVNGVRVEPAEITAALLAQPGVRAAAVVPRETDDGEKRLVGYVVAAGPDPLDPGELRRRLTAELPAAMLPAAVVAVERLPLTASGKLDRHALPAPGPGPGREFVAPSTPAERALAEIYASVLSLERVGAQDSFFDYGADSLLIIKVIAAARRRAIPLTLRMLYEYDTLAALAAALGASAGGTEEADATEETHGTNRADGTEGRDMPVEQTGRGSRGSAREGRMAADEMLRAMRTAQVPGVALALLQDGETVFAEGYGVTAADRPEPVTARTPFQVASVSKHVTVLAVLQLVSVGVLNLDADINRMLTSWQVPDSSGITLRELLSHQAGLSHVRPTNFLPTETMPSVLEVLTGRSPATNEPVRAEHPAGARFRKTNINYSVLQTLLQDVTGEPFEALMRRLVLDPLEMTDSSFDQSYPHHSGVPVAIGHDPQGAPIAGRWRIRNEVAAGGLWASVTDLAKVAREIRRAHRGERGTLITRPLAQQMLTVWHPGSFYGLGTVLDDTGDDLEFGHGGRTVGFRVATFTHLGSGEGLVVLANAESGRRIQAFVADALRRADGRILTGRMSGHWLSVPDVPVEAPQGVPADLPVRRAEGSDADE
ncbi:non-ribosomal peptide synthetase [Streptomyces sasae]|uniref:non-ribosomal peptide synthetase n=1 Tax=Streptomyces sasae TaxID=1266772 RepID=UPI002930E368|nr:non-ribosomal peptide synthetase [Streptomyces sasae]